jgi:hypothetical protein
MVRRMLNDDLMIRAATAARIIVDGVRERHKKRRVEQSQQDAAWSPLRSQIDEVSS